MGKAEWKRIDFKFYSLLSLTLNFKKINFKWLARAYCH